MWIKPHSFGVGLYDLRSVLPENAVGKVDHRLVVRMMVDADNQRNFSVRVIRSQNGIQQPLQRILSVITNGDNGWHLIHILLS